MHPGAGPKQPQVVVLFGAMAAFALTEYRFRGSTLLGLFLSIGIMAPILLALARIVQGLSLGGEYGTSATYMSEVAIKGRRGFFASFQYVTLIGGQLIAQALEVGHRPPCRSIRQCRAVHSRRPE